MKSKKLIIIISMIIIVIILITVTICEQRSKIFTKEKWDTKIWQREKMIDDLTEKYDLMNMTKEEITELLGTNGIVDGAPAYLYYIGKWFTGPVLFYIDFDENGRVTRYGTYVD